MVFPCRSVRLDLYNRRQRRLDVPLSPHRSEHSPTTTTVSGEPGSEFSGLTNKCGEFHARPAPEKLDQFASGDHSGHKGNHHLVIGARAVTHCCPRKCSTHRLAHVRRPTRKKRNARPQPSVLSPIRNATAWPGQSKCRCLGDDQLKCGKITLSTEMSIAGPSELPRENVQAPSGIFTVHPGGHRANLNRTYCSVHCF
jgi:hypothetical protein